MMRKQDPNVILSSISGNTMLIIEHLREAARNVAVGVSRAGLLGCLATVVISASAITDSMAAHSIELSAKEFQTSGAAVRVMRAPGQVDGVACDRLVELAGIEAAGAVRKEPTELRPQALTRQRIPVYGVSPRFGSFPSIPGFRSGEGMAVSRELAEMLGVGPQSEVSISGGHAVQISSVFRWPDDGRVGDLGFAFVGASAPSKPFDECWISLSPGSPAFIDAQASTLVAQPAAGTDPPEFAQLNSTLGSTSPDSQRWGERSSRWLPLLAFVCMALIGYAALVWRRLELATAQHLGVSRASLVAILSIETLLWYLPAVLASMAIGLLVNQQTGSQLSEVWWRSACVGAVGLAASMIVSVLQSSEKRLFNIFKGS
jgi:hypothetical protein